MLKIAWAKSQRKDTEDEVSNSKSRWLTKTTKRLIKIYEHHWLKQSFTSFLQSNTVIKYKFEKIYNCVQLYKITHVVLGVTSKDP